MIYGTFLTLFSVFCLILYSEKSGVMPKEIEESKFSLFMKGNKLMAVCCIFTFILGLMNIFDIV